HQNRYLHEGKTPNGEPEVVWLCPDGSQMESGSWENPSTKALMIMLNGEDESLLLLMNAHHEDVAFKLPARANGWRILVDTAQGIADPSGTAPAHESLALPPRSL